MILLRTHFVNDAIVELCALLEEKTGWRVCLMIDRMRDNPCFLPSQSNIQLTRDLLEGMGLYVTHDALWRCGDYAMYAARQKFRDVAFFWMIEPDIRINLRDIGDFFYFFTRYRGYDLVASHLGVADERYSWTPMMAPFASELRKCMFPIVRLSAGALDHLYDQRRALGRRFSSEHLPGGLKRSDDSFPNDEVFVATELHRSNFKCMDINDTGIEFYSDKTFSFAFPIPDSRIRTARPDGKIYHPVDVGSEYIRKVRGRFEHIRNHGGPAQFIRELFDRHQLYEDISLECGSDESERFTLDVRAAIAALEV